MKQGDILLLAGVGAAFLFLFRRSASGATASTLPSGGIFTAPGGALTPLPKSTAGSSSGTASNPLNSVLQALQGLAKSLGSGRAGGGGSAGAGRSPRASAGTGGSSQGSKASNPFLDTVMPGMNKVSSATEIPGFQDTTQLEYAGLADWSPSSQDYSSYPGETSYDYSNFPDIAQADLNSGTFGGSSSTDLGPSGDLSGDYGWGDFGGWDFSPSFDATGDVGGGDQFFQQGD